MMMCIFVGWFKLVQQLRDELIKILLRCQSFPVLITDKNQRFHSPSDVIGIVNETYRPFYHVTRDSFVSSLKLIHNRFSFQFLVLSLWNFVYKFALNIDTSREDILSDFFQFVYFLTTIISLVECLAKLLSHPSRAQVDIKHLSQSETFGYPKKIQIFFWLDWSRTTTRDWFSFLMHLMNFWWDQ